MDNFMPFHHLDQNRIGTGRYRLLGVNDAGRPYFYWSETPGDFAAYIGPSQSNGCWGTLTCATGKKMIAENRVFIADYETARRLEELRVLRPCRQCNKNEYERYKREGSPRVKRAIDFF